MIKMWRPQAWSEVQALIGTTEETPSLDFKRAVTTNGEDIAKDIAAMTVTGGVLVYGVDEDKDTRVATEIKRVPLNGVEERLRSVAGSRVAPMPAFDVETIVESEGDAEGIVVVVIPPSPVAPHQVKGRYPCRRGTTNDWLTEPEVDRLYAQRRTLAGQPPSIDELLEIDFVAAPAGDGVPMANGVGHLVLVVRPIAGEFVHPGGAWQDKHLKAAVHAARARQQYRFANPTLARSFSFLASWRPMEAAGWTAGQGGEPSPLNPNAQFAATMTYPARLSFQARWGLVVQSTASSQEVYRVAREYEVIRDLASFLAIAGEYFAEVNGAGVLVVGARLAGFGGAKAQSATNGAPGFPSQGLAQLPDAPDGVRGVARVSALELRDEPDRTTRALIERWLPQFYTDDYGREAFEIVFAPHGT